MREIKFRAWFDRHMYEVAKLDFWGDPEQASCDLAGPDEDGKLAEIFDIYLGEVELMQYTGFKDKNGKEIYEGDICRWRDLEIFNDEIVEDVFVVVWNDENLTWHTQNQDGNFGYDLYEYTDDRDLEVIGNIHENADLLEEEEDAKSI